MLLCQSTTLCVLTIYFSVIIFWRGDPVARSVEGFVSSSWLLSPPEWSLFGGLMRLRPKQCGASSLSITLSQAAHSQRLRFNLVLYRIIWIDSATRRGRSQRWRTLRNPSMCDITLVTLGDSDMNSWNSTFELSATDEAQRPDTPTTPTTGMTHLSGKRCVSVHS